jgi:hypothetical protein
MSLNYNGKYGTIEEDWNLPSDCRFIAKPADGRKSEAFPTAHHAMDYLKKKQKEVKR